MIRYVVQGSGRANVIIQVEGEQVVVRDNYDDRRVLSGYEECVEYSINSARDTCRPGFQKRAQPQYRRTTRRVNTGETGDTGFINGTTTEQSRFIAGNTVEIIISRRTIYFCTPSVGVPGQSIGCRGAPIYTNELGNTGSFNGSFNINVAFTPEEQQDETNRLAQELQRQQERDAETKRLQDLQDQRDLDEAEQRRLDGLQAIADQLSNLNQQGTTGNTGQYTGDEARENSQDTKYRIISPPGIDIIAGKQVPRIQYESIRFLSPESVSSYVSRGYVIEGVNPNTPTSTSKPYGASVLARSKILAPVAAFGNAGPRKRITLSDVTHNTGRPPTVGGVQKRVNNRRLIS